MNHFRHGSPSGAVSDSGERRKRRLSPVGSRGAHLERNKRARSGNRPARVRSTFAILTCIIGAFTAQDGIAFGETRTLSFLHTHTNETATITFRRNGQYDQQALNELNWLLRDWRVNEPAKMDPRLFDVLWEVHREAGSRGPVHIISAYRSPATNKMLRNRSRGVSEHSQHMSGGAMDIRLPDVDTARLRAVAMRLQYGGVGYYASSGFVHLDVGSVRAWPRMSQEQLAQLFPNGKTLHLPAEGNPLPGYEEAKSEILTRNSALALQASANTGSPVVSSWLSKLFGRGEPEYNQQGRLALAANVALADAEQGPTPPLPPPRPSELMRLNDEILADPPPSPDVRGHQPVEEVAYEPDVAALFARVPMAELVVSEHHRSTAPSAR